MGRYVMWIAFMVTLQFSAVLCRNPFQEYFYNKYHHKGHSTTASISSSASAISSEEMTASSVSDGASQEDLLHSSTEGTWLQNVLHSFTVDNGTTIGGNKTILQYGFSELEAEEFSTGLIIGIVLFVAFSVGILIFCCCWTMCPRQNHAGFVLNSFEPDTTSILPEQYLFNDTFQPNFSDVPPQQYSELPYISAVNMLYVHHHQSQMKSHDIPESSPPPYDAPSFEAPSNEAPPYRNEMVNDEAPPCRNEMANNEAPPCRNEMASNEAPPYRSEMANNEN